MNTKTSKTMLFAGLIAAMILPFSAMQFSQAELTREQQIAENLERLETIVLTQNRIQNEILDKVSAGVSIESPEIKALAGEYESLREEILEMKKQTARDIDPDLKQKFTESKFAIYESGLKTHTVYTDFDKLELVVGVRDASLKDAIDKIMGDTPYRLEIGEPELLVVQGSCDSNNVCNPLLGAAPMKDELNGLPCTIAFGATKNVLWWTVEGVVTVAHCLKNYATNGDAYQPDATDNDYLVGSLHTRVANNNCDCEFIESDSRAVSTTKIALGTSDQTLSGKADADVDDYIYYVGGYTGFDTGYVKEKNVQRTYYIYDTEVTISTFDRVEGVTSTDGDSGGPLIDAYANKLAGMLVLKHPSNGDRYFLPYSVIKAQLDLN